MSQSMTMTPFMKDIADKLKEERKLADSTILQYMQTLFKLNDSQPFKNLAWTKAIEAVQNKISSYAASTQATQYMILTSVLSLFADKAGYKKAYNHWREKMLEARKSLDEANGGNAKNEKQEEAWLTWEEIAKKKAELESKVNEFKHSKHITSPQFETLTKYLLLSLYTEIPPRRNQDFLDMYVVKKFGKDNDATKNYLDLTTRKFIFNKYKTAKTYGQQMVDIPDSLWDALMLYLQLHPLAKQKSKEYKLLVKFDGSPLSSVNAITRILNRIFGKKVGSSMLRHSYLSHKYGHTLQDMQEDAEEMGHSVSEATKTYVKFDDAPKNEIVNSR
jgi:integrase